jgi:hypothetical protein
MPICLHKNARATQAICAAPLTAPYHVGQSAIRRWRKRVFPEEMEQMALCAQGLQLTP